MDKLKLPKDIFTKKTQDYTFAVLFFVIFSMFIFFAIKPSLTTAASLKKEEQDLKLVDSVYESKIVDITTIQTELENNRDSLFLIDQGVSLSPQVNKMIDDIKKIADKNNMVIKRANIADINLLKSQKTIDHVRLTIEAKSGFTDLANFMDDLFIQRRLKTIGKMVITRDTESTASGSANLRVIMTIDGYYL